MKKILTILQVPLLLISFYFLPGSVSAQAKFSRDTIITAALEIIHETTYCGLVTVDPEGQPQVRTMNPFPVKNDLVIWFATSRDSRKVKEIRKNPTVSVYFADHVNARGYVNINGTAEVIDDKKLLLEMKRDYWSGIPNWQEKFVLIRIVPKSVEVINYKHNLKNDPVTFRAPWIEVGQ